MQSTPSDTKDLAGLKILVVEDSFLVADLIQELLESTGCHVVGPVGDLSKGVKLAQSEKLDGAVLDINLNGDYCFPIAAILAKNGVPFFFMTGYSEGSLVPAEFKSVRHMSKPFDIDELAVVATEIFCAKAA
jgi:CheY-like chemotaxis protein